MECGSLPDVFQARCRCLPLRPVGARSPHEPPAIVASLARLARVKGSEIQRRQACFASRPPHSTGLAFVLRGCRPPSAGARIFSCDKLQRAALKTAALHRNLKPLVAPACSEFSRASSRVRLSFVWKPACRPTRRLPPKTTTTGSCAPRCLGGRSFSSDKTTGTTSRSIAPLYPQHVAEFSTAPIRPGLRPQF